MNSVKSSFDVVMTKTDDDFSEKEVLHEVRVQASGLAFLFLMCCLAPSGVSDHAISKGGGVMLSHIHDDQAFFAFMVSLSFIIDGISIMRINARVFPGPHVKSQYEMA